MRLFTYLSMGGEEGHQGNEEKLLRTTAPYVKLLVDRLLCLKIICENFY